MLNILGNLYKKSNDLLYNMLIRRDELAQTAEEVRELERLCNEARIRYRRIIKQRMQQSWWDWVMEWVGY